MWFDCIPQADCEELSFQLGEVLGSALVNRKDLKSNILQARTKVKDFVRKLFKGGGKKKALSRLNDSDTVKPGTEPNVDPTDVSPGSTANKGLTFVLESSNKGKAAQLFEDSVPGAASDIASQKRIVPALRFDNPNPRGRNVVRFDGMDGNRIIDRKLNVTTKSKQLSDLQRLSEALRQNPDFQGVIQVPDAAAQRAASRALEKANVTNVLVEIVEN